MTALKALFKPGFRYRKAGVVFLQLMPAAGLQGALFDQADDARSKARMKALDLLNARFGRGTLAYGTAGEWRRWSMKRDFTSPRYTTEWGELLNA